MTNTIIKKEMDELLNELMLENHITLKDVYDCAEQHMNEIEAMMGIFDHKNDNDRRLALELIGILSQAQRDKILDFYRNEFKLSGKPGYNKDDVKLLLTACLYNTVFFSFAISICSDIKSRLDSTNIIQFPVRGKLFLCSQVKRNAAAGEGFEEFYCEPQTCNGISGNIHFMGNDQKQVYIDFIFDKPLESVPFDGIEYAFKTSHDHKEHFLVANRTFGTKNTGFMGIRSGIENNINYSDGIEPIER